MKVDKYLATQIWSINTAKAISNLGNSEEILIVYFNMERGANKYMHFYKLSKTFLHTGPPLV